MMVILLAQSTYTGTELQGRYHFNIEGCITIEFISGEGSSNFGASCGSHERPFTHYKPFGRSLCTLYGKVYLNHFRLLLLKPRGVNGFGLEPIDDTSGQLSHSLQLDYM